MKLFNNPKKAVALIMLVILLFAAYKSEATEMELGATYTGEFNGGYGITIIERVFDGKMDIGVALISDQQWENVSVSNNGNFFLSYVATRPENWWIVLPTEVHIGASHWIKTQSPINGCHLGYLLGLKWRVTDHASIGIRHWSNAGTCRPNRGQDILTFGWRF
jgi:hypothetical protein